MSTRRQLIRKYKYKYNKLTVSPIFNIPHSIDLLRCYNLQNMLGFKVQQLVPYKIKSFYKRWLPTIELYKLYRLLCTLKDLPIWKEHKLIPDEMQLSNIKFSFVCNLLC